MAVPGSRELPVTPPDREWRADLVDRLQLPRDAVIGASLPAVSGPGDVGVPAGRGIGPRLLTVGGSWCAPCVDDLPSVVRAQRRLAAVGGASTYAVTRDRARDSRALPGPTG